MRDSLRGLNRLFIARSGLQDPKRERQILIVLMMMGFTNVFDFMIMMPLAPHLIKAFGISTSQFGLLVSAYAFAAWVFIAVDGVHCRSL